MNENNELLLHIYENSDMGVKATKKLLKILKNKDNKIKSILETELHEYEEFLKKCKKIMERENVKPQSKMMASMMANCSMEMEIDKDNSDSKIADILSRGFIMGKTKLEKKISDYEKETSKCIIKIAKKSLEFQKNQIDLLKEYL